MFKIKYYLDKSKIHGLGIFAKEDIKKGKIIYVHNDKLDLILTQKEFNELNKKEKKLVLHYGYFNKKLNKWRLDHDDIRFCNHSKNSNITLFQGKIISKKNISKGEELLQNYSEFKDKKSLAIKKII
ncbi:SET domain-containing protein [Candidatus Pacearchaeota archaeon]|nr:SET domain-containing protein [Candidatus Pacearchaeota archaeon]